MMKLSAILFLLLGFGSVIAQDTLTMNQNVIWNHDTANFNDNINVWVAVENPMSSQYTGGFSIYTKVYGNGTNIVNIDSSFSFGVTIASNDTVYSSLLWSAHPSQYAPGNNITVIWPVDNGLIVQDSLILNTYIDTTLGIPTAQILPVRIYPNPVSDILYLDFPEGYKPKNIEVYTLTGELVMSVKETSRIRVSQLPKGNYIINSRDRNGQLLTALFIRQ